MPDAPNTTGHIVNALNVLAARHERPGWDADVAMKARAASNTIARFQRALQSIADNTCCEGCREAALVAREAIAGYPRLRMHRAVPIVGSDDT